MKQNLIYRSIIYTFLLAVLLLQSCGQEAKVSENKSMQTTAYINFGHKVDFNACRATGICSIQKPGNNPSMNAIFRYIKCQRPDNTDSMSISFLPDSLKTEQDSSHFQLDLQGRYCLDSIYVFDSLGAACTGIAAGTIVPAGQYATNITDSLNKKIWTIILPRVIRPAQRNGKNL